MIQVMPGKIILALVVIIALTAISILDLQFAIDSIPDTFRSVIFVVDMVLAILALKPVWRLVWWIFPPLSKITFPDINGKYDVELTSNWSIQEKMLSAAKGKGGFESGTPPKLMKSNLAAEIELGMFSCRIRLFPKDGSGVIRLSRTISCTLIKPCDGYDHRLAYIYHQTNRGEAVLESDENNFFGAGVLHIDINKQNVLQGEYWTNRAWQRAISTAGNITFTKIEKPS